MPGGDRAVYPPCMTVIRRLGTTRFDATLALGAIYVIGSMLPLAWRRTRPVEAALVSSAFWLIPLDGYPLTGFVAVILQFFALGSWGAPRSAVVLVTVW